MAASVCIAALVRNERARWLPSLLQAWKQFADEVLVLDDDSTDETAAYCEQQGCIVTKRKAEQAWGAESSARRELWQYAALTGCDWLFFLDADMVPARNPRLLFEADVDAIAFRLFDLWKQDSRHLFFREDGHWLGHQVPRVWAVRNPGQSFEAQWSERGIHCGHLPQNLASTRVLVAPTKMSLLHYGYLNAIDRIAKSAKYATVADQLSDFERAHAASITDANPRLIQLPFASEWQINYGF